MKSRQCNMFNVTRGERKEIFARVTWLLMTILISARCAVSLARSTAEGRAKRVKKMAVNRPFAKFYGRARANALHFVVRRATLPINGILD